MIRYHKFYVNNNYKNLIFFTIFPIFNNLRLLMLFGYIQNMVVNRCKHMKIKQEKDAYV